MTNHLKGNWLKNLKSHLEQFIKLLQNFESWTQKEISTLVIYLKIVNKLKKYTFELNEKLHR